MVFGGPSNTGKPGEGKQRAAAQGRDRRGWREALWLWGAQPRVFLLLMKEILYDLKYQNPRNYSNAVAVRAMQDFDHQQYQPVLWASAAL